mgnify:CR=1 FL=1
MHNLKDLRKNLDQYKKKFKDRNLIFDDIKFDKLDKDNRELINKKEISEQEKKNLSKTKDKSNFDKSKKLSDEIEKISRNQQESQKQLNQILYNLPNIAKEDVPIGKDEKSNKLIKKEGIFKKFSFKIKSHVEIGSINGNIDFDSSIKLSGSPIPTDPHLVNVNGSPFCHFQTPSCSESEPPSQMNAVRVVRVSPT